MYRHGKTPKYVIADGITYDHRDWSEFVSGGGLGVVVLGARVIRRAYDLFKRAESCPPSPSPLFTEDGSPFLQIDQERLPNLDLPPLSGLECACGPYVNRILQLSEEWTPCRKYDKSLYIGPSASGQFASQYRRHTSSSAGLTVKWQVYHDVQNTWERRMVDGGIGGFLNDDIHDLEEGYSTRYAVILTPLDEPDETDVERFAKIPKFGHVETVIAGTRYMLWYDRCWQCR